MVISPQHQKPEVSFKHKNKLIFEDDDVKTSDAGNLSLTKNKFRPQYTKAKRQALKKNVDRVFRKPRSRHWNGQYLSNYLKAREQALLDTRYSFNIHRINQLDHAILIKPAITLPDARSHQATTGKPEANQKKRADKTISSTFQTLLPSTCTIK